ncbi:MAG TPA: GTPase HflX, partial [Bryobacteraceae bacterium]|nr:GTPase HflX [Bryobacteraceae bacterium]
VGVSARTGEGVEGLIEAMERMLPLDPVTRAVFRVPHSDGATVNFLYEFARVIEKHDHEEYSEIVAETPESVRKRFSQFLAPPPTD